MDNRKSIERRDPDVKISRRHFMKYTGTVIFALGAGRYVFAEQIPTPTIKQNGIDTKIPSSHGYLIVDIKKCQGCTSCMLACTLVHEGVQNPSLARIQIIQTPFESFPNDLTIAQCRQCVEPACVEACPENAIMASANFGHARVIDKTRCIGCGECQIACPFTPGRPVVSQDELFNDEIKAGKCDLCSQTPYHWDKAGGGPTGKMACVEVCPVGAINFTDKIPVQEGDQGYIVNLRDSSWRRLGY